MPLEELQDTVDDLRADLDELVEFVSKQEEELTLHSDTVANLIEQLNTVEPEQFANLKEEIAEEQEKAHMLKETLVGQVRNLHQREKVFKEHLWILLQRKGLLTTKKDNQQVDIKLLLALAQGHLQTLQTASEPVKSEKLGKRGLIILVIIALVVTSIGAVSLLRKPSQNSAVNLANSSETEPEIPAVTALGRIEPQGEVIKISAPSAFSTSKIGQLLVKEGDWIEPQQAIALLDYYSLKRAALEKAEKEIQVAKANLAIIKAGAKAGEIKAQQATIARLKGQLQSEMIGKKANVDRLQAQLASEEKAQKAAIARLKSELNNAEIEFKRYEDLVSDGAAAVSILDQRRTSLETAQEKVKEGEANLKRIQDTLIEAIREAKAVNQETINTLKKQIEEAKAHLERIAEVRTVDVEEAQAQVEKAIAAFKEAEADLELAYVKAPMKGQIIKINTRAGETIDPEKGIAELGQTQQMMVVAEVYESDIVKVKVGQKATITSESGAFSHQLEGTVSEVGLQVGKKDVLSSDPAADVDVRVVEVKIKLDPKSSTLVSGLTYARVIAKILI